MLQLFVVAFISKGTAVSADELQLSGEVEFFEVEATAVELSIKLIVHTWMIQVLCYQFQVIYLIFLSFLF